VTHFASPRVPLDARVCLLVKTYECKFQRQNFNLLMLAAQYRTNQHVPNNRPTAASEAFGLRTSSGRMFLMDGPATSYVRRRTCRVDAVTHCGCRYTSNIAAWFCAHANDVAAPQVLLYSYLTYVYTRCITTPTKLHYKITKFCTSVILYVLAHIFTLIIYNI